MGCTRVVRTFFELLLRRRWLSIALVLVVSGVLGSFAAQVKPDFSVEHYFPSGSQIERDYTRFKADFPYEDALALVVVEAEDLWTRAGLERVKALEEDLSRVAGVLDTDGLTTTLDVAAVGSDDLHVANLFEALDLSQEDIDARRRRATEDPIFAWRLSPPPPPVGPTLSVTGPHAGATTVVVTLEAEAAKDEVLRTRFYLEVQPVLDEHRARARAAGVKQTLVLSGIPVVRSQYNALVQKDFALFGLALLVVLVLLYVSLRSVAMTFSALVVIVFAVVWTYGAMGITGLPLQVLTSVTPLLVMIISISDTAHIVAHYREAVQAGVEPRQAVIDASVDSAVPCLLTELTIAAGFLTLLALKILVLEQFAFATAMGMMLAWLANMLVLPLILDLMRPAVPAAEEVGFVERGVQRLVPWIEHTISKRPWRVVLVCVLVVAAAGYFGSWVERVYYSFDDLYDDEPMKQDVDYIERVHGGIVPLMIHVTPPPGAGEQPMLDPVAIALLDRMANFLEEFPQIKSATSSADLWRKSFEIYAPEMAREHGGIPPSREAAAQLFLVFGEEKLTRHHIRQDLGSAAVVTVLPNMPSTEGRVILKAIHERIAAEELATGYRLRVTGLFANLEDIDLALVEGLGESLGMALLITFGVFWFVLRSGRLAFLALIPNVLPLALTLAFMGITGIALKPSTVIVFTITLVIADDNTIQYYTRFRRILSLHVKRGEPDPCASAAVETLRRVGLPIFLTAATVSLGFLILLLSRFKGLASLGLLTGVSLASALLADLFVSPLLAMKLGPRIGLVPGSAAKPTTGPLSPAQPLPPSRDES